MITTNFMQFLFNLILAGALLRFAETKLLGKDNQLGKALAFVY
jgi:hypothetical protein